MARLVYVHWNEDEAREKTTALEAAGHQVLCHASTGSRLDLGTEPLDALVISLDRLPSHGRAIAEGFWSAKKRQSIPVIFVGGSTEKVEAIRPRFSRASFVREEELVSTLAELANRDPHRV